MQFHYYNLLFVLIFKRWSTEIKTPKLPSQAPKNDKLCIIILTCCQHRKSEAILYEQYFCFNFTFMRLLIVLHFFYHSRISKDGEPKSNHQNCRCRYTKWQSTHFYCDICIKIFVCALASFLLKWNSSVYIIYLHIFNILTLKVINLIICNSFYMCRPQKWMVKK